MPSDELDPQVVGAAHPIQGEKEEWGEEQWVGEIVHLTTSDPTGLMSCSPVAPSSANSSPSR